MPHELISDSSLSYFRVILDFIQACQSAVVCSVVVTRDFCPFVLSKKQVCIKMSF